MTGSSGSTRSNPFHATIETLRSGGTGWLADLRSAVRQLRRSPGFLASAAGTLGAALAVNIAIFTLINAAVFRGPPYETPEQLHRVTVAEDPAGGPFESPTIERLRAALGPATPVAAYTAERPFVIGSGDDAAAISVHGSAADDALFDLIGMTTAYGRAFTAEDVRPGAPRVAILYVSVGTNQFGDARAALGRTVRIDGEDHEVIGVVASRAVFPDLARVWVPLVDGESRRVGEVSVIGRFAGVSPEMGASAIETALAGDGIRARAAVRSTEPAGGVLFALMLGGIAFVLLIACVNVANLMLARGTGRRHELGVRAALGASRWRLVRYLSAEGVVLAAVAVAAGSLAAVWLTGAMVSLVPADQVPVWFDPAADLRVVLWAMALGVFTVLASAMAPGLSVTRGALQATLRESGGRGMAGGGAGRTRAALVAAQLALATTLLAGAGLLLRTFVALRSFDPGYAASAVLEVPTRQAPGMMAALDPVVMVGDIAAEPAVRFAGASAPAVIGSRVAPAASADRAVPVEPLAVSRDWFETLGLPLVAGRTFLPAEERTGNAVVLSRSAAESLFGSASAAVNASVRFEGDDSPFLVTGVVGDRRAAAPGGLGVVELSHAYVTLAHADMQFVSFVVRGPGDDPGALASVVTSAIRGAGEDVVVLAPRLRSTVEGQGTGESQFFTGLFAGFGLLAFVIALLGVYSVVAYTVGRRRREIGVRIALGATPLRVFQLVIGGVAGAVGAGVGIGLVGAVGLGFLLRSELYGVGPVDPVVLVGVTVGFAVTAGLAAVGPARRAVGKDPLGALRSG